MSNVTISDSIKYIGVDDTTLDLFESQYIIPNGVSYNSYIILDDKIAVMDTVDARKISVQALGKYFPNSPMLAAAVAVSGVMKKDAFISEMRASYQHKFAKKPEVIDGNMQALELTYEELKDVL